MSLLDDMANGMMNTTPTEAPEKLDINEGNILYALRDQSTSNRHLIETIKQIAIKYEDVRSGCKKLLRQRKRDLTDIGVLGEAVQTNVVAKIEAELTLKRLLDALGKDGNKKAGTVLKSFQAAEEKRKK